MCIQNLKIPLKFSSFARGMNLLFLALYSYQINKNLIFSGIALATYFLRLQIVILMRGKRSIGVRNHMEEFLSIIDFGKLESLMQNYEEEIK